MGIKIRSASAGTRSASERTYRSMSPGEPDARSHFEMPTPASLETEDVLEARVAPVSGFYA
jgi:hypothetical protein